MTRAATRWRSRTSGSSTSPVRPYDAEIRKHAGVELKEVYWTQGPYDLVEEFEGIRAKVADQG
jgi:uncharacterized protein with GYD domain